MASQVRMNTSESRSRRSGRGSERQTSAMPPAAEGERGTRCIRRTTSRVARARAIDARRPSRTPIRMATAAMTSPPSVGAIRMGTRRRMAWTEKPTARRPLGRASPTTAKSVGLAILVQHMTNTRPSSTTGHRVAEATMAYPTAARLTNRSSAQRLEILGDEAAPQILAQRHEEHRGDDGGGVPLESEGAGEAAPSRQAGGGQDGGGTRHRPGTVTVVTWTPHPATGADPDIRPRQNRAGPSHRRTAEERALELVGW